MLTILMAVLLAQQSDAMDRMVRQKLALESLRSGADEQMDMARKQAFEVERRRLDAVKSIDTLIDELVHLRSSLDATNTVTDLKQRRRLMGAWKRVQKIGIPDE